MNSGEQKEEETWSLTTDLYKLLCYFKQVHLDSLEEKNVIILGEKNPFYNLCTYIEDYKIMFLTLSFLSFPSSPLLVFTFYIKLPQELIVLELVTVQPDDLMLCQELCWKEYNQILQ